MSNAPLIGQPQDAPQARGFVNDQDSLGDVVIAEDGQGFFGSVLPTCMKEKMGT